MSAWQWTGFVAATLGVAVGLYGLHRLCLWLETRGLMYYLHKKPESGSASCFLSLQGLIEPRHNHVLEVREQRRSADERDAEGAAPEPDEA